MKKGYLQISFGWLFALIVGMFIIFLAIYGSMRVIDTGQTELDAATAKEIGVLLNPLETSFESGTTNKLTLPSETRIYNKCSNSGTFGKQIIKVSQKSFNKWSETDVNVAFNNKYIFSDAYEEGKIFYLFSKPFEYPFKVANLIFMSSKDYCLMNSPEEIGDEISDLKPENIHVVNCSVNSIKVCFSGGSDCDMNVFYDEGKGVVQKGEDKLYFAEGLIYGAIFSEKNVYECQVKRLMQRIEQLSSLYRDKSYLLSQKSCNSNLEADLLLLGSLAKGFDSSEDLNLVSIVAEDINKKNEDNFMCKLW